MAYLANAIFPFVVTRSSLAILSSEQKQHAEAASEKYEQRCSEASQTIEALKVSEGKKKKKKNEACYGGMIRRPRWLGRWSASLSRSISWVQVPPSACS